MRKLITVVALLACSVGCIKKTGGTISPWERFNVDFAAVGQINNDVAKGIIAVQGTGAVSVVQAAPILNYQELVAKDHAAVENILNGGSAQATSKAAEIQALLEEIKIQGTALVQSGGLGVKNPKSQQTFTQDLQGIVSLTEVVLSELQTIKGQ